MQIKVTKPRLFDRDPAAAHDARYIEQTIERALLFAERRGMVVEVTLDPEVPLAQGHYTPHIHIRERKRQGLAREAAHVAKQKG